MKAIIKRELRNYLRNPILWAGFILVAIGIYQMLAPYLTIHYFEQDEEIKELKGGALYDADIMDGYMPATPEQRMELGYKEIEKTFVEVLEVSEEEAARIIDEMRQKRLSIEEAAEYLKERYSYHNAQNTFEYSDAYKGTAEEINAYIQEHIKQKPFSFYFSRKFADAAGLYMGFFSAILLAFLYIRDTRKDTYELLHTKPVSPAGYICGKAIGGILSILLVLGMLNVIFGILCVAFGNKEGFPVSFWDMIAATALYIIPNVLMIVSIYTVISLIFKNPLPAVPMIFIYMLYSNMGSIGADGEFDYYGRPLAIMVRFPGWFFETSPPPLSLLNQTFLIIASCLLLAVSAFIWKRRRI